MLQLQLSLLEWRRGMMCGGMVHKTIVGMEGGGQPMLSFEQFYISSFPFLNAFVVGDLGFEFCVFVAGWRHALRSEWPFMIIYHYYYASWLEACFSE